MMKITVGKYTLDKEQTAIVKDNHKHLLVVAGAGSGKSLTLLGKIKYLVEEKNIDPKEILCISFTQAASNDLRRKIKEDINLSIDVYTFHKLSLEILSRHSCFEIADSGLLEDIMREFFYQDLLHQSNNANLNVVKRLFNLKTKDQYQKLLEENPEQITALCSLLSTFIHLFKSNNHSLQDFLKFLDKAKLTFNFKKYKREKILLTLAITIYNKYTDYLEANKEIDFDDMLIKAKKTVDKYGFFHKLKYILIDEYQDTSLVRFNLVESILEKTNAKLVAVGDDFQSIYRFTGCDLSLFLDFKKMFKDGKILKIQNTYRNSQELIDIAGSFVMKNKAQIKKKLCSDKSIPKPIIIKNYSYAKNALTETIYYINDNCQNEILILGRNNKDINYFLDKDKFKISDNKILSFEYPELQITYLTAHKSKGLESNNVILINLTNSTLGFPSQQKDDDLLRFVSPHKSKFPYDEERRLFYVALTRTKNKVYLLTPNKNKSIFVEELENTYKDKIEYLKSSH